MNTVNLISEFSNILLVVHTVILYPIFKFAFALEKRLTILETELKQKELIKNNCFQNCKI